MEAFVAAFRNLAIGDRLSAVLQFLAAEGFTDEVVIAAVPVLVDPTFDAANSTLNEIKGIANVLGGAAFLRFPSRGSASGPNPSGLASLLSPPKPLAASTSR